MRAELPAGDLGAGGLTVDDSNTNDTAADWRERIRLMDTRPVSYGPETFGLHNDTLEPEA
jgi:hypothetical protein